jgi:hypothetical protein
MTDSKTPEWATDARMFAKHVAQAPEDTERNEILAKRAMELAYERGRKEGIEEAAKVAASGKIYSHDTTAGPPTVKPIEHRDLLATAIRQLLEVKG